MDTIVQIITGIVFALLPLVWGIRFRRIEVGGFAAILAGLFGFAMGWLIGLILLFFVMAVLISFTHHDKTDPFTSRVSLDEVNFEESRSDYALRTMGNIGRFLRNKGGFIGFLGIIFFISLSVVGPYFVEYEGRPQMSRLIPGQTSLFREPCIHLLGCADEQFILGLDWQGRDIFSHLVHGGRNLIITSLQAGLLSTTLAVILGSFAGLAGGIADQIISSIANFILTIPQFPLLLVIAGSFEFTDRVVLALLLGFLTWPPLMRAIRAQVLSLRERDYVEAAMALDLGLWHIISREVFPNMVSYIAINMIFAIRASMYAIVRPVLIGVAPMIEPDWGIMISNGMRQGAFFNRNAMWMVLTPIAAIALFQLSLVLFTRSLEEIFNPRLRSGL